MTSPAAPAVDLGGTVAALVADGVASRIAAQDAGVWGPDARSEASIRLGWTRLHETSRPLLDRIHGLRDELAGEGIDRVVLCGMGGSSLAPEVICGAAGVPLVVLDSTDPSQVAAALTDLARTVVVVSSKSGATLETDSQRRSFVAAFSAAGIDPATRLVVVTDPGSALEGIAVDGGYRAVFNADPSVGGRYSALTAFGLVPSALAGADVTALLDQAAALSPLLGRDDAGNPALVLGAALAATPAGGGDQGSRGTVVIVGGDDTLPGFGDWAEQLIAESTGKLGRGVLPVSAGPDAQELSAGAGDVLVARVSAGDPDSPVAVTGPGGDGAVEVGVTGALGAQFLLWEFATVVAGQLLGINPFDQPDVESAKVAARGLLDATPDPVEPAFVAGDVSVTGSDGLLDGVDDVATAVTTLLGRLSPTGYVAVMAYLDRLAHAPLADVRDALAARTGRPVTFGWGPRFLHSTGQFHKGGPAVGVFIQVLAGDGFTPDLEIPDRPFSYGRLIAAQAAGDAAVLAARDTPVLTLTVSSKDGLARVRSALEGGA